VISIAAAYVRYLFIWARLAAKPLTARVSTFCCPLPLLLLLLLLTVDSFYTRL